MAKRPKFQRSIKRGRICDWADGVGTPDEVAVRVTYTGNPVHKSYPSPAGPPALRADKAKCDVYNEVDWPRLLEALRDAIRAQCVGEFRGGFPSRAWVWINDVLHEARLTGEAITTVFPLMIRDNTQNLKTDWRTHHVSKYLSIDWDPIDQPAAKDPVERRTWCALRIRVGGRTVTRMWDKVLEEERSLIFLPAFPIVQWLVENWWMLLNEPSPAAELPKPSSPHLSWIKRHCLRSSESGLLLPALFFFNDGRGVGVEWQADEPDVFQHMPGEFFDSGVYHLEKGPTEMILAGFVNDILRRVDGLNDERVDQLKDAWQAVQSADAEEASFCVAAGRMGVDPYDPSQVTDELATFIEEALGDPDHPLARDLTEAAQPDSASAQWSWVQQTKDRWKLGPLTRQAPISTGDPGPSPWRLGYRLAAAVRKHAELSPCESIPHVEEVAGRIANGPFRTQEQNHVPGSGIRAAVGWKDDHDIVVAGPWPKRSDSQRFLAARGLYHALFACGGSERLITDAYTWDQQASRAFAAELLAPRAALTAQSGPRTDHAKVEELATSFGAGTMVIEKQLEHAGVAIIDE